MAFRQYNWNSPPQIFDQKKYCFSRDACGSRNFICFMAAAMVVCCGSNFPSNKNKKIDSNYSEKCDKYLAKCVFIARFIGAKGICIEIERL